MSNPQPDSPKASVSLAPGAKLGPYTIVRLIGAGGMGEVYRAHDARLGRDVAIKILRRSPTDTDHVTGFSREARAVGSLNHPNIVAVFDVDTEAGVPYVVTELLEGETLRARLDRGTLPYRKAIEYGIQIAQALDAAHAKGIWHRDVKPANAFITEDGRVKLLDFGIAKLSERPVEANADTATDESTQPGEICGTAGYMSPEQVLGAAVDHRTDIFALGAVLYEMFTGTRAFQRASTVQTMTAVLQDEPIDPLTLNAKLPPAASAIVRRCLEKDKEDRFQSARDLAFDLQQLRDITWTGPSKVGAASTLRRKWLPALLALAVLVQAIALGVVLLRPDVNPTFEQLTFRRGRIGGARFASDGQAVVYSEAREANALEVLRIDLADSPTSRVLPYPPGTEVLATRAGQLALSLDRKFVLGERFVGRLAVAPIGGGAPRELALHIEDADWDPSGTQLAVVRSTGDVSGSTRLEYPLGTILYETTGSIRFVRVSRDGRRIAFIEDPSGRGVGGHIAVVDLQRQVTKLTDDWATVRGLAWSVGGDELWFAAGGVRTNRSLYAVNLGGTQRVVLQAPASLTVWDIAPDGRVLLTRDEERRTLIGVPPGETMERDLSWFDSSGLADLSADGQWLLFADRFGIYQRKTDGSPPTFLELKDAFADDLSPDGKTILATTNANRQLMLLPTGAGQAQPVPAHGIVTYRGAQWLPDGRRILVNGIESGRDLLRSYIQDLDGGAPRPLTPENTWVLSISPDGEWTAAISPGRPITLWPIAGGPSRSVQGSLPDDRPIGWSADGRSLWIFRRGEVPAQVVRLEIASGQRHIWKTLAPPAGVYSIIEFRITPSGHSYFYSYTQLLSQLYVMRGLE